MKLLRKILTMWAGNKPANHVEPDESMKYLIAGLGNMGPDYDNTRHNVGFDVVDQLARKFDASFRHEKLGDVTSFKHRGRTFVLLKPSTYMNRSGQAVRYWLQKENIPKERLLVVVDDIHLPFGKIRLRARGSDGGHNGLKSIDQLTGGNNYARLRIGIGNDFHPGQQAEYVLSPWTPEQQAALPEVLERAVEAVLAFGTLPLSQAMNIANADPAQKKP
ncbi:MAG: peptidyl-tRNA hydrolase [Saprospiraceae bacterium]|nr:MAG: peptidyl-tRNA hydrolase [Saprospiraceae bacterium]